MLRNLFRRSPRACDPQVAQRVLIASEGRRFSADVIETAVRMLRDGGGQARVLTIARLWGTSFGLPNPGLRPSKSEMAEQQDNVRWAIGELEKAGVDADGHIVTTRNPGKSILNEARRQNCRAIVMATDPKRPWLIRSMIWSQEPYRVLARAHIPVHLVGPSGPS